MYQKNCLIILIILKQILNLKIKKIPVDYTDDG